MRKKNITRKLIMSISTAAMTAICLGTTTYAWFSRNANVWVDETDLYVNTYDGLLISLDGTNFSQDITSDELKQYITGKTTAEEAREAYKGLNLIGNTMKQDANGKVVRGTDGIEFTHDVVNHVDDEYINYIKLYSQSTNELVATLEVTTSQNEITKFIAKDKNGDELVVKDKDGNILNETTGYQGLDEFMIYDANSTMVADIVNFEVISYVRETFTAKASATENYRYVLSYVDNGYSHNDEDSIVNKNYLKFDLYFRISSDYGASGTHPEYNLRFTEDTFLKTSENAKVILNNSLISGDTAYSAGDEIEFDVANAMRIGVDSESLNIFEVNNNYDLGSVAIEGSTDPNYDKDKNAMYTYYNSLFPNYPFKSAAENGERFVTKDKFTDTSLGVFKYSTTENKYNDVKASFYIWLEGWDADYFLGTAYTARQMSVKLEFKYLDD